MDKKNVKQSEFDLGPAKTFSSDSERRLTLFIMTTAYPPMAEIHASVRLHYQTAENFS